MHSRFMKRLRAKACKLRKRLAESSVASPDVGTCASDGDGKLLAKCSELHEVRARLHYTDAAFYVLPRSLCL